MFAVFTLNTTASRQTNKTWSWQLTQSFSGLLKNSIYVTISTHLALLHVREAFPDMYSSSIVPHKCPGTNLNLVNTQINVKRSKKVKNKLKRKLLYIYTEHILHFCIWSKTLKLSQMLPWYRWINTYIIKLFLTSTNS